MVCRAILFFLFRFVGALGTSELTGFFLCSCHMFFLRFVGFLYPFFTFSSWLFIIGFLLVCIVRPLSVAAIKYYYICRRVTVITIIVVGEQLVALLFCMIWLQVIIWYDIRSVVSGVYVSVPDQPVIFYCNIVNLLYLYGSGHHMAS